MAPHTITRLGLRGPHGRIDRVVATRICNVEADLTAHRMRLCCPGNRWGAGASL